MLTPRERPRSEWNPRPSWCEATLLATSPPCRPTVISVNSIQKLEYFKSKLREFAMNSSKSIKKASNLKGIGDDG